MLFMMSALFYLLCAFTDLVLFVSVVVIGIYMFFFFATSNGYFFILVLCIVREEH